MFVGALFCSIAVSATAAPREPASQPVPVTTVTTMAAVRAEPRAAAGAEPRAAAKPPATNERPDVAASPTTTEPPRRLTHTYHSAVRTIDAQLQTELRVTGMWSEEAPVALTDLRVLEVDYWGFDHATHTGRIIVNQAWAVQLAKVFGKLYAARFPIRRMDPVDYLGMNGEGLLASDDTMSFNGRKMRGGSSWSMHAYGLAVDIDPAENPYLSGKTVIPEGSGAYADRSRKAPGVIQPDDVVVQAFASIGWKWGGGWGKPKDYMHFSSTGR